MGNQKDKVIDYYNSWDYVYERYLGDMFNILNKYRGNKFNIISSVEFSKFLFDKSSQYISPYA